MGLNEESRRPIAVKGVSSNYGDLRVVDNVTFDVSSGEIVSILGPSGCGKSTLLHIIAGLDFPDTGQVWIDGADTTGSTGVVGLMSQRDLLLPWRTVFQNVCLAAELKGIEMLPTDPGIQSLFDEFGLDRFQDYYPHQLSGGMKQRAALMRTYLFNREIMLLDEPFGALDSMTRRAMRTWLLGVIEAHGSTVLLVTHDVEEAVLLSDRVIVMSTAPGAIVDTVSVGLPHPRDPAVEIGTEFRDIKLLLLQMVG